MPVWLAEDTTRGARAIAVDFQKVWGACAFCSAHTHQCSPQLLMVHAAMTSMLALCERDLAAAREYAGGLRDGPLAALLGLAPAAGSGSAPAAAEEDATAPQCACGRAGCGCDCGAWEENSDDAGRTFWYSTATHASVWIRPRCGCSAGR